MSFLSRSLLSQNPPVDSLKAQISTSKNDTTKLRLLVQISEECELDDILMYAQPAVELADVLIKEMPDLNTQQKNRILNHKAHALNNMGYIYNFRGDIQKALDYYSQSLKIQEKTHDKTGIATSLNNIGLIHSNLGERSKALDYYQKSLKLQTEIGNKIGIAASLVSLAYVYEKLDSISKALTLYNQGLKIFTDINYKAGIASTYNNIAIIYDKHGKTNEAIDYYLKAIKIQKEIGDKQGIAYSLNNIASLYLYQKKYSTAIAYADSAISVARELGFPETIAEAELSISLINTATGNHADAFEHYKQYIKYKDSLNNETTRKAGIKNQLKYEYDKKEAVIKEQQERERAVAKEKNRFQQIVIGSVIAGLMLVIVFAVFIFRSLKTARKQKIIIEEKQKEILDSILYARRIQRALITPENYIEKSINRLQKDIKRN